jgi:hypothetical protein
MFVGIESETATLTCQVQGQSDAVSTVHAIRVDLAAKGLTFEASVPASPGQFNLVLPTDVLHATGSQVAFNANLFTVCCTVVPLTPPSPGTTGLCGFEIGDGHVGSPAWNTPKPCHGFPFSAALVAAASGVRIVPINPHARVIPVGTAAVTGSHPLLLAGRNVAPSGTGFFGPNARTLVGLGPGNHVLWIAAVDATGSGGVTLPQAAQLMKLLGAVDAINLDGGGSTALAVAGADGAPVLLNLPTTPPPEGGACGFVKDGFCERYVGAVFAIHAGKLAP